MALPQVAARLPDAIGRACSVSAVNYSRRTRGLRSFPRPARRRMRYRQGFLVGVSQSSVQKASTETASPSSSCPTSAPAGDTEPEWTLDGATGSVAVTGSTDAAAPMVKVTEPFSVSETTVQTLTEGDGPIVAPTATVSVCYMGVDGRDGHVFDSSYERGAPVDFPSTGVVPGFQKAITGQKVGSTVAVAMTSADGYPKGQPGPVSSRATPWSSRSRSSTLPSGAGAGRLTAEVSARAADGRSRSARYPAAGLLRFAAVIARDRGSSLSTAGERAAQLALVSRLKTIFPEVPEWPTPTRSPTRTGRLPEDQPRRGRRVGLPHLTRTSRKSSELMTYVLCEVLARAESGFGERRRLGNVDVGRAIYLGLPYYSRWLWSVDPRAGSRRST